MKILITGGHPTPALALIDELKKKKNLKIVFVGRKHPVIGEKTLSFEYQEIKKRGVKFIDLKTGKLPRFFTKEIFINFGLLFFGFFSALMIILKEKPDFIISFGSFLAFPIAFWAFIFRIPIFLHEQTIAPGLANRIIGLWAKKIFLAFPNAQKYFNKKKTIIVGNPIRFYKIKTKQKIKNEKPVIYITGGSLGSHAINLHIEKILPTLLKKYLIIHQTGNIREFDDYNRLKNKFKSPFYFPFTHLSQEELFSVYQKADLVVSRAGANTFFELIAFEKPTIFIPLPYSASKEQFLHAKIFKDAKTGEIFNQDEESEKLLKLIDKMIDNLKSYQENFKKLRYLYQKNAPKKMVETIFSLVEKN